MENDSELEIGTKTKASEIMRRYPETTDYFVGLGVCECGFDGPLAKPSMTRTLEEIAREKNITVEEIMKHLEMLVKK